MHREGREQFSCREAGSQIPCRVVSGLVLVNYFPNELILINTAYEKQGEKREDGVDIALEASLEDDSIPDSNHVVFHNFHCKWGICTLKMTEEEKAPLVGG